MTTRTNGTPAHDAAHAPADGVEGDRLTRVTAPEGVAPGNGYAHVVWGTGRFAAISGQCAFDESGAVVGVGDPAAQAERVFENLRRCLAAAGADFRDVIKLTYFLTDMAHLPAVRAARDAALPAGVTPASSAVRVAGLVRPELLLEVEALALLPDPPRPTP
ncbi:RidA family protein [Streptomyces sp. BI20]|uniref:RidA family protein n=1 Tax=Streptomyces sp. BI20 TaxID=3403460 RepID=UPI003C78452E